MVAYILTSLKKKMCEISKLFNGSVTWNLVELQLEIL